MPEKSKDKGFKVGIEDSRYILDDEDIVKPLEGYKSKDFAVTWEMLQDLVANGDLSEELGVKALIKIQRQYNMALERESQEAQQLKIASQQHDVLRGKRLGRRKLLGHTIFGGLSLGTVSYIGGKSVYNNFFNPDIATQRATDEEVDRQREREDRERLESNILGLEPTPITHQGWRIFYLSKMDNVIYQQKRGEPAILTVENASWISFPNSFKQADTGVGIRDWTKLDGTNVTSLSILFKAIKDQTQHSGVRWTRVRFFLRNKDDKEVDARVVVFEHVENDQTAYVEINKVSNDFYEFRLKDRIVTNG